MKYLIITTILSLALNSNIPGFQELNNQNCPVLKKTNCPISNSFGCKSDKASTKCPKETKDTCQKKLLNRDLPKNELKIIDIVLNSSFYFIIIEQNKHLLNLNITTDLKPEKPDPPGYSPLLI